MMMVLKGFKREVKKQGSVTALADRMGRREKERRLMEKMSPEKEIAENLKRPWTWENGGNLTEPWKCVCS